MENFSDVKKREKNKTSKNNQPTNKNPHKKIQKHKKTQQKTPKRILQLRSKSLQEFKEIFNTTLNKLNIWGCQTLVGFYKLLVSLLDLNFPRFLQALMQNSHCIL